MRFISSLLAFIAIVGTNSQENVCTNSSVANGCVQFTVSSGTGCAWMCQYCANQLGTNNYYFTDGVCTYQSGGCVGNPVAGKQYQCCQVTNL